MDLLEVLQVISWAITGFGVIVIVLAATWAFLFLSYSFLGRRTDETQRRLSVIRIRGAMTNRIIFGLDFLIASDIIISTIVPSIEDIARLGGTVLIRVILTYIITRETQELERREHREGDDGYGSIFASGSGKNISEK